MNHIDKTRLQELLSAYIDDELPRHRRRQVEELIEQDEKIAGELRFLQRQKHMLGLSKRLRSLPEVCTSGGSFSAPP